MKKLLKEILYGVPTLLLMTVSACSDDDEIAVTDPYTENYVYLRTPVNSEVTLTYRPSSNEEGYEVSNGETVIALPPIRCTKPAAQDITVTLAFDYSLLDRENAQIIENTHEGMEPNIYESLPNAWFEPVSVVIPQGSYEATEAVSVHIAQSDIFDDSKTRYAMPIALSAVSAGRLAPDDYEYLYKVTAYYDPIHAQMDSQGSYKSAVFSRETDNAIDYEAEVDLGRLITLDGPAAEDYTVRLAIDSRANLAYPYSSYATLTSDDIKLLTTQVTIPMGETQCEETVKILVPESALKQMGMGQTRCVPIVIQSVEGKGLEITNQYGHSAYALVLETAWEAAMLAVSSEGEIGGTRCDNDFIEDARINSNPWYVTDYLRPGSIRSYSVSENSDIFIAFKEEINLAGFSVCYQNAGSYYYNAKVWNVSVSTQDGVPDPTQVSDWTEIGDTQSLLDGSPQYVKLKTPQRAKYMKIKLVSYYHYATSIYGGMEIYRQ